MKQKSGFLADLFAGPGNAHWDLGRIATAIVLLVIIFAVAWNALHGPLSLAELGALITGGLGPCAAWVAAKAYERRQTAKSANEIAVAEASAPSPEGTP